MLAYLIECLEIVVLWVLVPPKCSWIDILHSILWFGGWIYVIKLLLAVPRFLLDPFGINRRRMNTNG